MVGLCSVRDRGNVGTIIRTCDAVGASAVVITGETSDPFGPHAVRASVGAVFTQKMVRASLSELKQFALASRAEVIGTSPHGSIPYHQYRYKKPLVMLAGNEGNGLSQEELVECDVAVSIPMMGYRDSLNVAVASSIILYHVFAQWNDGGLSSTGSMRSGT